MASVIVMSTASEMSVRSSTATLVARGDVLMTEVRLGEVGDGAREVCAERRGITQRVELGRDANEGLLDEVFREGAIAGEHQCKAKRPRRVRAVQPVEELFRAARPEAPRLPC